MLLFFLTSLLANIDMFEESFALVNKLLPDKPLTIFNVDSDDLTMPLRLTDLSDELLLTQLFMIRFNYGNKFWLSSIVKTGYRSINGYPYLVARYSTSSSTSSSSNPEPNLNLEYVRNMENDKVYKITSEGKCMTVGDENTKGEISYHPLVFKECDESPLQEFIFIPRIVTEKFLKKEKAENVNEKEIQSAYKRLYNNLKISINYSLDRRHN